MMSRLFPWVLLFRILPYPRSMWWLGQGIGYNYMVFYKRYKEAVVAHYKQRLRALDNGFAMSAASDELVRRREAARAEGIGPADPEYPDLWDVVDVSTLEAKS